MAISTTPASGELRLALDDILVGDNVRDLDEAHVDNLAQSIALRGLLVPLIVRPTTAGYELVAGYHRYHACRKLGLDDVPVVLRDTEGSSADAAAENVTRKQLTPLEEAKAVQAMLDEGYTLDGAAQALGWSRQLVTARAKILKLSEPGQALVGSSRDPGQRDRHVARDQRRLTGARRRRRRDDRLGRRRRVPARQQRRLGDRPGLAHRRARTPSPPT